MKIETLIWLFIVTLANLVFSHYIAGIVNKVIEK